MSNFDNNFFDMSDDEKEKYLETFFEYNTLDNLSTGNLDNYKINIQCENYNVIRYNTHKNT